MRVFSSDSPLSSLRTHMGCSDFTPPKNKHQGGGMFARVERLRKIFVSAVLVVCASKFFPRSNPFVASLYIPRMDMCVPTIRCGSRAVIQHPAPRVCSLSRRRARVHARERFFRREYYNFQFCTERAEKYAGVINFRSAVHYPVYHPRGITRN